MLKFAFALCGQLLLRKQTTIPFQLPRGRKFHLQHRVSERMRSASFTPLRPFGLMGVKKNTSLVLPWGTYHSNGIDPETIYFKSITLNSFPKFHPNWPSGCKDICTFILWLWDPITPKEATTKFQNFQNLSTILIICPTILELSWYALAHRFTS